jgi:hypothetical protein
MTAPLMTPQPRITAVDVVPAATRGWRRVLRFGVLGGVSLGLATAAHLAGGGRLPSPGVLAVAGLLLGMTAVTLTAKRCRFRWLLPVLVTQQVLLHLLFEASASATACGLSDGVGMAHPAGTLSCGSAGAMAQMSAPGWTMWVGHLTVTLLTAWLLARGEAWLWRTAREIVRAANAGLAGPSSRRPAGPAVPVPTAGPGSLAVGSSAAPRAPPRVVVLL